MPRATSSLLLADKAEASMLESENIDDNRLNASDMEICLDDDEVVVDDCYC